MRKCLRCNTEMVDGYQLEVSNLSAVGKILLAKGSNIFSSKELGKVSVSVCPSCGEISLYFDNTDKIKKG